MRAPTAALLWEIGRQHCSLALVIAGLTAAGWLIELFGPAEPPDPTGDDPLSFVLALLSFLVLFGVFNYTESSGDKALGRFPQRLFTLPVSSLRLVAVPVVAGVVAVELLYVVWMERLPNGGPEQPLFVGVLLAAFMVFYQAVLWTLVRLGTLRLVVLGGIAIALFGVAFIPSIPASSPSLWRSQAALGSLVAGLALTAFLLAWRHVARQRSGGGAGWPRLRVLVGSVSDASPASAHFWFEWRCSGMALPVLVAGVLLVLIAPLSWLVRDDPSQTLRLVLATLVMPVLLALPVGIAFSKPTFWSNDLSMPTFVAVRPLSAEDLVAVKVQVATASAAVSWLLVLVFLCTWLSSWANLDSLSSLAIQWWAFHRSVYAVYGIASLVVISGLFLTWRFLLTSLWSGSSGRRALYVACATLPAVAAIACVAFDASRLLAWLFEDPAHMLPFVWGAALLVIAKYWFAAFSWRRIAPRLLWRYLLLWGAATTCFVTLALVLWGVLRTYLAMDVYRFQSLLVLLALMVVPLGRVGLAPAFLASNRHRR